MNETIDLKAQSQEVWSVQPDSTVYDAIALMANEECGAVLVIGGSALVGIVTERDYARKVILQGWSSKVTRVSEIMTRGLGYRGAATRHLPKSIGR